LILLLAATLAAAAPSCANVVTPEALVCRALEAQQSGDSAAAAQAFEQAAIAADDKDGAAARMFAAAGNLWIAAGQPGKAAFALDRALALPGLEAEQRGEALLDRSRAAAAQGDLKLARAKLNEASATIAGDPFYWYFSAGLAIREGDKATAESAINKALRLAPGDATLLFEAGHVADFLGKEADARSYWMRAAAADPNGETGKAARKAVEMLGLTPTVKNEAPATK